MKAFTTAGKLPIPYDCKNCTCCVFGEQNSLIEAAINQDMENFI
jgi:hypothetical protein